jgi:hypothetical protein
MVGVKVGEGALETNCQICNHPLYSLEFCTDFIFYRFWTVTDLFSMDMFRCNSLRIQDSRLAHSEK